MYLKLKPIFDFTLGLILLVLLSPFLIMLTTYQAFLYRGKPFFIHQRPGKNGKLFRIIKFRTMNNCYDAAGNLMPDCKRITAFGKLLRRTSIDELPQLINVIKGDMSLIGPRPLLQEYLTLYTPYQRRRHEVRPGITGLAQIRGRNSITWLQKFDYDVWYVDHISFKGDFMILMVTIIKVFKREGISQKGFESSEPYLG